MTNQEKIASVDREILKETNGIFALVMSDSHIGIKYAPAGYWLHTMSAVDYLGKQLPVDELKYIATSYALVLGRLGQTFTPAQVEKLRKPGQDLVKFGKSRLMQRVINYLRAGVRCEQNRITEELVGEFYADRYAAEKLRLKINPESSVLDDGCWRSESFVTDVIMGKVLAGEL